MSELITTRARANIRLHLLASVSALSLLTAVASQAKAEDADRPTVWIELGGQLEQVGEDQETFAPAFLSKFDHLNLNPVLPQQRPPRFSNGAEGKISFMPEGSDWALSAGVRYGRANSQRSFNQQLPKFAPIPVEDARKGQIYYVTQVIPYHLNSLTTQADRHLIVDFQVGKDVGLGLFGRGSTSVMAAGVRFAQFTSTRRANLNGEPDFTVIGDSKKYGLYRSRHHYTGSIAADSSFHGIGPSLSWDASAPLVDRGDDGQISVDWGVSAAVLFGRQKTKGEDNATGSHYTNYTHVRPPVLVKHSTTVLYQHTASFSRSRRVTVPNVGGFAGISVRYSALKVSMGYRADVYFGAMDGGIETRDAENRSFYGPFASFSIGLGG